MYLCSCSCTRTGRRSASTHSDSVFGIEHAVHRREQHGGDPLGQLVARDDVARVLVVGAILDDELHLVVRRSRARLAQSFFAASPLPGHLTSMIVITPAGTCAMLRWPPVSSSTVLPGSSSRCISG